MDEESRKIILDKIEEITYSQLSSAVSLILAKGLDDADIDDEIAEYLAYWKGEEFSSLSRHHKAEKIRETCDFFYEFFRRDPINLDVEALRGNRPFASNIIGMLDNPSNVRDVMFLYCKYIAALSTKPKSLQETFFNSFPPKTADDIACLGGTATRIDDNLRRLTVSEQDQPILDTHQVVISQVAESLKPLIRSGNHIHILSYLIYAFSLEDRTVLERRDQYFLTPQFRIPSSLLFARIRGYTSSFKERLGKDEEFLAKVSSEAEELKSFIDDSCKEVNSSANDLVLVAALTESQLVRLEELKELGELKRGLKELKELEALEEVERKLDLRRTMISKAAVRSIGDLVEYDDEEDMYIWSREKILQANVKKLLPHLFSEEAEYEVRKKLNQDSVLALSQKSGLFTKDTSSHILNLLKSEDVEEVTVGLEALWVLAENMVCNSKLQVVTVVNALGGVEEFDKLKSKLVTKPNYLHKIDRVKDKFDVYVVDPDIKSYLAQRNLAERRNNPLTFRMLINIGAPLEDIIGHCRRNYDDYRLRLEVRRIMSQRVLQLHERPDYSDIDVELQNLRIWRPVHLREITLVHNSLNDQRFKSYIRNPENFSVLLIEQLSAIYTINASQLVPFLNNLENLQILHERLRNFQVLSNNLVLRQEVKVEMLKTFAAEPDSQERAEKIIYFLKNFPINFSRNDSTIISTLLKMANDPILLEELQKNQPITFLKGAFYRSVFSLAEGGSISEGTKNEMKFLAMLGLDFDREGYDEFHGKTAAHIAAKHNNVEALELFQECGATLDVKDNHNKRPIHRAIKYNRMEAFEYLLNENVRTRVESAPFNNYVARPIKAAIWTEIVMPIAVSSVIVNGGLFAMGHVQRLENFKAMARDDVRRMTQVVKSGFSILYEYDPSVVIAATKEGKEDFLKKLLERGVATPLVPYVRSSETRKILNAGQCAEELAKSVVTVVKTNFNREEKSKLKDLFKMFEIAIKVALVKGYDFDARAMEEHFGLEANSFERNTPKALRGAVSCGTRTSIKIENVGSLLSNMIRSSSLEESKKFEMEFYESLGGKISSELDVELSSLKTPNPIITCAEEVKRLSDSRSRGTSI